MRAEDLELLEQLSRFDNGTLRDLDNLACVLLRQNGPAAISEENRCQLRRMARTFGWRLKQLKAFLLGVKTTLNSPVVAIEKILATPDFCLMHWHFKQGKRFSIPAKMAQPLAFYLITGHARLQYTSRRQRHNSPITAGEIFQSSEALDLECRFEADTEVLFFDFPVFREAHRDLRRFARFRP
ncbi:MAG: hypothetical protein HY315_08890 [Acidobacteria bacterium]|nr:hypothetical protein [Acidobacteriota bacterium]